MISKKKQSSSQSDLSFPKSSKQEKLFYNLARIIEQYISGKGFIPSTADELMIKLSLPEQHKEIFKEVLHFLCKEELIEKTGGKYVWINKKNSIVTGVLRLHHRGFGFVQVDDPSKCSQDIFIPKHLTKNGVDGDHVEVLINSESNSDKGPEGKIIAILSRSRTHIAGIIRHCSGDDTCQAFVPLLGSEKQVIVEPTDEISLKVGDRIVMEVIDWGTSDTPTLSRFSHYLGHISDPSCDITAAIEEFDIREDFPSQAIDEATTFGTTVSRSEIGKREDLRQLEIVTIDPDTAKDFDDAISLEKDKNGHFHLGVHIADVSHYVQKGSALDQEAALRCNSTYFPRNCIPMLPPELSENLCSLKPKVNRLTISVFASFDSQGSLLNYRIARTVIKSAKRFSYKEAKQVLDGKKKSPFLPLLKRMVELCRLLKQKRQERGSIEFSLPELMVHVDEKGDPTHTEMISYDITHQMIEEFMLKANEIVATHLSEIGKQLTYRVHDVPAEENLKDFSLLAAAFGFSISTTPTPSDLQKLFEEAQKTSYANYLAASYIRKMKLASYSPENIGHYGLSLTHYCHFTSPIRRYTDLIVHRILFEELFEFTELQKIAHTCSEQERLSAKAEGSVILLKKLRLLSKFYQEDPRREYEAVITRVKNFGISFEITALAIEGFIHISDLGDDYFVFEEKYMRLRGRTTNQLFATGDILFVLLEKIDLIEQEAKWTLIGSEPIHRLHATRKLSNKKSTGKKTEKTVSKKGRVRRVTNSSRSKKTRRKK